MGLFSRSTKPSEDLLVNGLKGTAVVQEAHMGGIMGMTEYSGYMSQKKQEQLLTGETSMTKYKLHLEVTLPGRSPYDATITVPVPMMKSRYMTGGSTLPVLVDPNKDSNIAIDWAGEFQSGTIAQMADANPMIAAAMRGAGVDIARITQLQEAQRAAGQTPGNVIINGQLMGAGALTPQAPPDPIAQLQKLGELRASGVLTDAEFEAQKAKILAE